MLFLLTFISNIINLEGLKLSNGREIFPSTPLLTIYKDSWYYINCKDSISLDYLKQLGIQISSLSFISPQWVCEYLTSQQASELSRHLFISEVLPIDKLQTSIDDPQLFESKSQFLVYAHDSFIPNNYSCHRIYKNFYVMHSFSKSLLDDPKILSITPYFPPQLLNRFSRGSTQQKQFSVNFDQHLLIPDLPFHRHGLTGQGQIVTMVDSGLDYRLCYFNDTTRPPPFNITDFSHRKIVRYEAIADNQDANEGHGSHVGGIIAGDAQCTNCTASLYNGHAPGAKLFVVDAGYASNPSELTAPYDMEKITILAKEIGSHIMSNSWGYPPNQFPQYRILFDKLCYDFPDITFFFGSGNSRKQFDIWAPANSKNSIAVGGSVKPDSDPAFSTNINNNIFLEKENGEKERCHFTTPYNFLQAKDPLPNFVNQTISESFIILRNQSDCELINSETNLLISFNESIVCNTTLVRCNINESFISQIKDNDKCSLFVDYNTGPALYSLGVYTSKGPANTGLLKPDLYAPGSFIRSARGMSLRKSEQTCQNLEATSEKSGTSMATPAAAGASALLVEYLMKGYYPEGSENPNNSLVPNSALIKALLINSASPLKGGSYLPDTDYGFGSIHIHDGVLFADETERMKQFGLRISNPNWTVTGTHHSEYISKINISENVSESTPLIITLSWLDPPTSQESRPIYADLDLYVESPDGKVYFGNSNDDHEESYSTSERITIMNPIGGEYIIHVTCPHLPKPTNIDVYVVVNGPFNHLDFDKNPKFLDFALQDSSHICTQVNKTGHLCQHDVINLVSGEVYRVDFSLRKGKFYYFQYKGGITNLSFSVAPTTHLTHLYFGIGQVAKFGGESLYFRSLDKTVVIQLSEKVVQKGDYIYLSLYELYNKGQSLSILLNEAPPVEPTPTETLAPTRSLPEPSQSLIIPTESLSPTPSSTFSFVENPEEIRQIQREKFKTKFFWVLLFTISAYILVVILTIIFCKIGEDTGVVTVTTPADNIDLNDHSSQSLLQDSNNAL